MKTATAACVLVAALVLVDSAPAPTQPELDESQEVTLSENELQRSKRSQYGSQASFVAPCAASAPAYHISLPPAIHSSGYGLPSPSHGYAGGIGGFSAPHYRSDGFSDDSDLFRFDMDHGEHFPMMRAYGGFESPAAMMAPAPASNGYGASTHFLPAPAAAGPAMGYFPGANIGGCNVPLLLSCSPSITPGRMMKSQPQYSAPSPVSAPASAPAPAAAPAAPAYRATGADVTMNHHMEDHHMDIPSEHHSSNHENSGQLMNHH